MNSQIFQKLIETNFAFVNAEVLPLIEKDYLRVSATEVVERLKETLVLLVNGNGSKDQLNQIWSTLASDPELLQAFKDALQEAIGKIDEPQVQALLNLLVEPVVKTVSALTDGVKPDGEQLKAIWKDFIESPELVVFILSNVEWLVRKVIKDEAIVKWIVRLIETFKTK